MKTYAVITAAGVGSRIGNHVPKQFVTVEDKPICIYTIEAFQRHPGVDGIVVSCLGGWETILRSYIREFNITKPISIVMGGLTGQESIRNALEHLSASASPDDFVIIHDGNRPLVSQAVISNAIGVASRDGSAVAYIPCTEVIARRDKDAPTSSETINRDSLVRTQTPHVFRLGDILDLHERAYAAGIETAAAPELLVWAGREIYFSEGEELNFKITTQGDLEMFRAIIGARRNEVS